MNINEVYLRIIETENDSDVVKLAKKEVMVIPILINAMLDENNCRAQNILIDLSEQTPLLVYPYFQYRRLTDMIILQLGTHGEL